MKRPKQNYIAAQALGQRPKGYTRQYYTLMASAVAGGE